MTLLRVLLVSLAATSAAAPAATEQRAAVPSTVVRLGFAEACAQAMAHSTDAVLARATGVRAVADAALAAERPNPVLTLTPDRVVSAFMGNPWSLAAGIALTLFRPGEGVARRELRGATNEAAALDAASALWRARTFAAGNLP